MGNRRFEMHEYRQVIVRLRLGESQRSIEKNQAISRKKINKIYEVALQEGWLEVNHPLPPDTLLAKHFGTIQTGGNRVSAAAPYKDKILAWLNQGIRLTAIYAALVRNHGYTGSYDSVKRLASKYRENNSENTTIPLDFKPGEYAQVDFGKGPLIVDTQTGEIISTWVFVMVLAFSRHLYAEIVRDQKVLTWLKCHRHAFEFFGGVVSKITIDNAKCAITRAHYYDPEVQRAYADYAEAYGFIISACPPREPKKKGRVEAGVKYIKRSFLPLREFSSLQDANEQLTEWILETAGNRIHGSMHQKPLVLFTEIEKALLKTLPQPLPELASWSKAKVHGDCHVQFEKCRYSVPYRFVKKIIWLRAGETTLRIYDNQNLIAIHPRLFKWGLRHTLEQHLPPNSMAYVMHDSRWCLKQAETIGKGCHELIQTLLNSSVVDYLRASQGIIHLQKKYGAQRLELACQRALLFNSPFYKTVKEILKRGLDYEALPSSQAFNGLAKSYSGKGLYCRNTKTLLIH